MHDILIHVDGGANSHIFQKREHFLFYTETESKVTKVTGSTVDVQGMGIVPITFGYYQH